GQAGPCSLQRHLRHVRTDQRRCPQVCGEPPVAAAEVEGVAHLGQRANELDEMLRWGARAFPDQLPELVVEARYQAPLARRTAGIVLSMIDRSRNTDQRSR
ncbi:MAG: hypothetical protein QOF37_2014, partial [Thermoleophilaceae bacterium]|nr:hypothetical protein [Thermoleophilaceae bacterium]